MVLLNLRENTMFDLSEQTEQMEMGYGVHGIIPIETGSTCYRPNTVAFKV